MQFQRKVANHAELDIAEQSDLAVLLLVEIQSADNVSAAVEVSTESDALERALAPAYRLPSFVGVAVEVNVVSEFQEFALV